ncbi:PLPL8 phospholipase, partial [Polypterus senegalus]
MSRIRNTFDSVTKAVSGSHTELLNKIVRLKPNALVVEKPSDPQAGIKELNKCVSLNTKDDNCEKSADVKPLLENGTSGSASKSIAASTFQKKLESSPVSKDIKTDLFHPSYISTNFGETYNFVSNHINGYFTRKTGMEEEKNEKQNDSKCVQSETSQIARNDVDGAATDTELPESTSSFGTSISPKKKIAQFLLYPSNSVQAFVDNYLGTFVPKFRQDTKDIAEVKDISSADVEVVSKKGDHSNGKDPKSAEEKAKRLSLQREKEKIIPCLLRLRQNADESLQAAVREALSLVGYADPVKGNGIRVLSIDGGGTRGLVALQTLYKLEELTGKPVYQLFDYICGVSTGTLSITGVVSGKLHFKDGVTQQDGGLLINNPSALALHECKCLWPDTPVQCLISLGTGRYESLGQNNVTYTSLKTKLTNVISSATDTEEVHTMLDALLLPDTYFRFNPVMNEDIPLDENRKEKLNQLQMDGIRYLERNENKLKKAAKILMKEKTTSQKVADWIKLKAAMYDGIPPFSKL